MEAAFVAAVLALAHRKRIASLFFPCIAAHQAFTFCHGITGALSHGSRPCGGASRTGRANERRVPAHEIHQPEPAQGI